MSFGGGSAIPVGVVYVASTPLPIINDPGILVLNSPLNNGVTVATLSATPSTVTWTKSSGDSSGFFNVSSAGAITVTSAGAASMLLNQSVTFAVTATSTITGSVSVPTTITAVIDQYVDGYNNQPTGTAQFPALLNSYGGGSRSHSIANQPSWYVAGVDYPVGVPTNITLITNPSQSDINTASNGATISGSTVTLTGASPTLGSSSIGFIFPTNTVVVVNSGATGTATVQNCRFSITTANNAIGKGSGTASVTVQYCDINGNQFATHPNVNLAVGISFGGSGTLTCYYNYLHGLAIDAFGSNTGVGQILDIRYNLINGFGYSPAGANGGHPDTLQFIAGTITRATFAFNTLLAPPGSGQGGDNPFLDAEAQPDPNTNTPGIINNLVYANNVAISQGSAAVPTTSILFGSFVDATTCRLNGMSFLYNYGDPTGTQFQQYWGSTNAGQMQASTPTTGIPSATNIPASGTAYVMLGNTQLTNGVVQPPFGNLIGYVAPGTTTQTTAAPSTDILGITTSPVSGTAGPGTTITFTLTCSRAMTVVGSPTLTLNNGKTATYSSGSGTTSLVYTYTVQNGDTSQTNIATTAATANVNATHIIDAFGNLAGMTGALRTFTGLNVSGTNTGVAPVVVVRAFDISVPVAAGVTIATATASQGTTPITWTRVASSDQRGDFQINANSGAISFTNQGIADFGGTNPTAIQTGSLTVQASNQQGASQGAQSFTFYADGSTVIAGVVPGPPTGASPTNTTSPTASLQQSNAMNTYGTNGIRSKTDATRQAPWNIAGVDYRVGINSGITLKDPNTAGFGTGSTITVNVAGTTLDGYDFSIRGQAISIQAANVTIRNCRFGDYSGSGLANIFVAQNAANFTVEYNEFDYTGYTTDSFTAMVNSQSDNIIVRYNAFLNTYSDVVSSGNGSVLMEYNLYVQTGPITAGQHPDIWQPGGTGGSAPISTIFRFNTALISTTQSDGTQAFYMAVNSGAAWAASQQVVGNTLGVPFGTTNLGAPHASPYNSFFAGNTHTTTTIQSNYLDVAAAWNGSYNNRTNIVTSGNFNMRTGATAN